MWILVPGPGIKPMYSALQGGFLTTELPWKSPVLFFNENSGRVKTLELKRKKSP